MDIVDLFQPANGPKKQPGPPPNPAALVLQGHDRFDPGGRGGIMCDFFGRGKCHIGLKT